MAVVVNPGLDRSALILQELKTEDAIDEIMSTEDAAFGQSSDSDALYIDPHSPCKVQTQEKESIKEDDLSCMAGPTDATPPDSGSKADTDDEAQSGRSGPKKPGQRDSRTSPYSRLSASEGTEHLIEKLNLLGLNSSLCNWILDFPTGRPQSVRIGNSTTTLSTGAPQGYVLSPLLFTLLTHDCAAMHSPNIIVKFTDGGGSHQQE
ncbi:hypothetical protein QTP86_004819 [Hemibagrus guttatus]|nr:hypothetical protein QTP86_004819 [Hemibagrus guttatus]